MNPISDYDHTTLKQNPWVVSLQNTQSPMELMGLLITRILKPEIVGPRIVSLFGDTPGPLEILRTLIDHGILSTEKQGSLKEALQLLLELIVADKPITPSGSNWSQLPVDQQQAILLNLFIAIWYLPGTTLLQHLLRWVQRHREYLTTDNVRWREVYAAALEGVYFAQDSTDPLESLWTEVLNTGHSDYWQNALIALGELNVKSTLEYLPKMIQKGMPKLDQVMYSLYFRQTSLGSGLQFQLMRMLKLALNDGEYWAAVAINALGSAFTTKGERGKFLLGMKVVDFKL